ncbi:Werner Syndrome-like exonuclease [Quillaja saponaria]|uniref:Werner Syndrome-like exonuclease n=1 Tax=Quillaja saponaria TaxID=32244 RepID=A0AAD7KU48_QUISA|nr:Werner Syndrome-like exonuclease [Quillaja saponaria]
MYSFRTNTNPAVTTKFPISFDGKIIETTVTDKGCIADEWIQEILSEYPSKPTVVGLDIEWKPNTITKINKAATLQLCINDKCLILQLFYMNDFPQSLKDFLLDSNFIFVGVKVADDIEKLRNEYGLGCSKHADIRELAMKKWPGRFGNNPGLKGLALEIAGVHIEKPKDVSRSNWQARVLEMYQIEYGCIDAYASYLVGHKLLMEGQRGFLSYYAGFVHDLVSYVSWIFVLILVFVWLSVCIQSY